MARRRIQGSRALVTGASSGIGREIARQLAHRGATVVVTARRSDRLDELVNEITDTGGVAFPVAGDITRPDVRRQALEAAEERYGGLDVLVNNAGLGAIGNFATANPSRLRSIMEVNFFATVELIRAALPLLREGNRPLIVNIASVLGHFAVPEKSEYCASKFAIHGFSDALRAELAPAGVDVLLVSPSTTNTEFFDHVIEDGGLRSDYRGAGMPARTVAQKTLRAMERGKHEIILSAGGRSLVWLDRLMPTLAHRLITRYG